MVAIELLRIPTFALVNFVFQQVVIIHTPTAGNIQGATSILGGKDRNIYFCVTSVINQHIFKIRYFCAAVIRSGRRGLKIQSKIFYVDVAICLGDGNVQLVKFVAKSGNKISPLTRNSRFRDIDCAMRCTTTFFDQQRNLVLAVSAAGQLEPTGKNAAISILGNVNCFTCNTPVNFIFVLLQGHRATAVDSLRAPGVVVNNLIANAIDFNGARVLVIYKLHIVRADLMRIQQLVFFEVRAHLYTEMICHFYLCKLPSKARNIFGECIGCGVYNLAVDAVHNFHSVGYTMGQRCHVCSGGIVLSCGCLRSKCGGRKCNTVCYAGIVGYADAISYIRNGNIAGCIFVCNLAQIIRSIIRKINPFASSILNGGQFAGCIISICQNNIAILVAHMGNSAILIVHFFTHIRIFQCVGCSRKTNNPLGVII